MSHCRKDPLSTRLLLFGAPGLAHGPDDSEILALQPKRAAVLTYLMVARPGPLHRRDSLLAMFWPEHDADRGRNALSKVIHHLRRALPSGAILVKGDQIGIDRLRLWCDVTEFEGAIEAGRTEDAFDLFGGDFLQGFHISGSPDFDHWSDIERSRLRRMAVASAWELASEAERAGDGTRATKFARQAVEWAPRDESGFRRFLGLLQSRGNRVEALEAFETFARELQRDYGVEPSSPTLELVEAIREGRLPYDLAAPVSAGPEPGSPASGVTSPEPVPAEELADSGVQHKTSIRSPGQPHPGSRPRRKLVSVALAVGVVALIAWSLYPGGPFSRVTDPDQAGSVLVTEFDDGTGEGLGAVVSEALRIDLAQSRALALVDRADIVGTLELMGLESNVPISPRVAREVAVRDGFEALVEGSVVPAGTGYILTAAILEGGNGRTVASFRESITAPDQVIAAIDQLSLGIRKVLGEKLSTIEESLPLERVTTHSLEALTLYTRATTIYDHFDDRSEAASLLQRAVALDPGFAMAWRMLAVAVQNDADQSLRLEAVRQAYRHRERLGDLERHIVESSYYSTVERDRSRATEALLRVLDLDPDNARALNNLGINYLYMSKPHRAEEIFGQVVQLPGASSTTHRNLIETRLFLGRIKAASQALDDLEQAYPDYELIPGLRAQTLFLAGAVGEARAVSEQIVDDPLGAPTRRADAWAFLARIAFWEGRHEEGRRALLTAERIGSGADEATAWTRLVKTAHTAALIGDVEWARSHIEPKLVAGIPDHIVLDGLVQVHLIELLTLTSLVEPGDLELDRLRTAPRMASVYRRIEDGDTVGLRTVIEELPLGLLHRVLLADRLGDLDRTIELYETVLQPGYPGWGNTPHRLRALMRLGPLYEEAGDTLRATAAYNAFAQRWALGDELGRAVAEEYAARALILEAGVTIGIP